MVKTRTVRIPVGYKLVKVDSLPKKDGLDWWKKRGFKVTKEGLSYTSKKGLKYDAVEGVTQDGKTLLLKKVKGGSVYTQADF